MYVYSGVRVDPYRMLILVPLRVFVLLVVSVLRMQLCSRANTKYAQYVCVSI